MPRMMSAVESTGSEDTAATGTTGNADAPLPDPRELIAFISSDQSDMQQRGLTALVQQPAAVINHLNTVRRHISSLNPQVQLAAMTLIAELRDDAVAEQLVVMLENDNEVLASAARQALIKIAGRDRIDDLAWQEWLERHRDREQRTADQFLVAAADSNTTTLRDLMGQTGIFNRHHQHQIAMIIGTLLLHQDQDISELAKQLLARQTGFSQYLLTLSDQELQQWLSQYGMPGLGIETAPGKPLVSAPVTVSEGIAASAEPEPSAISGDAIFIIVWVLLAAGLAYLVLRKGKEVVEKTIAIRRTRRYTRRLVQESQAKGHTARISRSTQFHRR